MELAILLVCVLLGVALDVKVLISVALLCLCATVPDLVTGFMAWRKDPEPNHGRALFWFFVASGLAKTGCLGIAIFCVSLFAFMFLPGGIRDFADIGGVAGFALTTGFFLVVLPPTVIGAWFGRRVDGGVMFCPGLTKLRRGRRIPDSHWSMSPYMCLGRLAVFSAISASLLGTACLLAITSFLMTPKQELSSSAQILLMTGFILVVFVIPIGWYIYFATRFADPWGR